MVRRRSRSRDWGPTAPPVCPGGGGSGRGTTRRRSCGSNSGGAELEQLPLNMAAAEQHFTESAAPLPPSGSVPVLFCFSVFARPSSVPHSSGYEVLIQKFLSLYGDQLDMHRKFVVQLFSEEWSQYIDLPKGFLVNERCKVRLVPLQIQLTTLGNLTPSSTVFFCCDMQERFRPAIKYFGDIISVGQRLLQGARILGIPVIVTEQYPKGLGSTVQEIDLTGAKLVLPKTKFSMVLPEVETALAEIPGVRSVVLFGVETHVCIQQTALELVGRGLEVHIVADATSSRSMMDRMFALERFARTGIIVTTSEAILLQLIADKDHPKFKEIQNLIKASAPESGLLSKV
ncbi:PREDICTED: isochorismatase domain-containing protein 1 [Gekko japonicus]|uniref:Isochorismatase domain-containing protein 1 n=1 Tax=Gekko japonicus TaxID=146911 RepID=A0ABM1KJ23_GEKJA|nr:PREDICTED: isochorismatase domain-containing protein 1 [Gekko japonicus]